MAHNTNFHLHNDVWIPEDLGVGDIIKCRLPTFYDDKGVSQSVIRNAVVVGLEVDPKTLEVSGLYTAKFDQSSRHNDETCLFIDPEHEKSQQVVGLGAGMCIPTKEINYVPMDIYNFGYFNISRMGHIAPAVMDELRTAFVENNNGRDIKIIDQSKASADSWVLPGARQINDDVNTSIPGLVFEDIDESNKKAYQLDYAMRSTYMLDGQEVEDFIADIHKAERDTQRIIGRLSSARKKLMSRFTSDDNKAHRKEAIAELMSRARVMVEEEIAHEDQNPNSRQRYEAVLTLLDEIQDGKNKSGLQQDFDDVNAKRKVSLPNHLWQGRYIQVNLPSVMDNKVGNAYRPCVVWKAYGVYEDGEKQIKALEVIPATRSSADAFNFKMQVYPLKTRSKNPSFLAVDARVIVPVNARCIQDNLDCDLYELPLHKIEELRHKEGHMERQNYDVHQVNLCKLDEEWEELPLDPAPKEQQMAKWMKNGFIKIDGELNNKRRDKQASHKEHKKAYVMN